MERLYKAHPEKIRALGKRLPSISSRRHTESMQASPISRYPSSKSCSPSPRSLPQSTKSSFTPLALSRNWSTTVSPRVLRSLPTHLLVRITRPCWTILSSSPSRPSIMSNLEQFSSHSRLIAQVWPCFQNRSRRREFLVCVHSLGWSIADQFVANAKFIDLTEEDIAALHEIDKTHHFRACNPNWAKQGNLGFPDVESTT